MYTFGLQLLGKVSSLLQTSSQRITKVQRWHVLYLVVLLCLVKLSATAMFSHPQGTHHPVQGSVHHQHGQ